MQSIGIIGGTGFNALSILQNTRLHRIKSPYGMPSGDCIEGDWMDCTVVFLARHGQPHRIPPHEINYRANLYALKTLGCRQVVAVNAVGGIHPRMLNPGHFVVPDQMIDYTWGRASTFWSDAEHKSEAQVLKHIDFTEPYSASVRAALLRSLRLSKQAFHAQGVYGCTQGPRLETRAEIERLERDGCDVVGMTAMPEAALARELGLEYGSLCLVANAAAGKSSKSIGVDEIRRVLSECEHRITQILAQAVLNLLSVGESK